jgi:hypothetical protein
MIRLYTSILVALAVLVFAGPVALASTPLDSSRLSLTILSSQTLSGVAGDFVTVQGTITNTGSMPVSRVTTYLSMVDADLHVPVDLEDWSAEKGLYIGTIDTAQSLPLNWKIHFVKAGHYSLVLLATRTDREVPEISTVTHFIVNPKRTLDPGHVLPVALGMPVLLAFALVLNSYRRQRREQS